MPSDEVAMQALNIVFQVIYRPSNIARRETYRRHLETMMTIRSAIYALKTLASLRHRVSETGGSIYAIDMRRHVTIQQLLNIKADLEDTSTASNATSSRSPNIVSCACWRCHQHVLLRVESDPLSRQLWFRCPHCRFEEVW